MSDKINMSMNRTKQRQNVMQILYQMELKRDYSLIKTLNIDEDMGVLEHEVTLDNVYDIEEKERILSLINDFSSAKCDDVEEYFADETKVIYGINTHSHTQIKIENFSDMPYINLVLTSFVQNRDEVDKTINSLLTANWKMSRLSKIDLSILRTAMTEMMYADIPYKIAINEALEMAKKFSDEKSAKFINGVLKDYVKTLEQ